MASGVALSYSCSRSSPSRSLALWEERRNASEDTNTHAPATYCGSGGLELGVLVWAWGCDGSDEALGGAGVMPLSRRQRAIMISVVSLQAAMCSFFISRWDSSNVRPKAERTARVDWYISPVMPIERTPM